MVTSILSLLLSPILWPINNIIRPPLTILLAPISITVHYVYNFWIAKPLEWILHFVRILYPMYLFLGAAIMVGLSLGSFVTGGVVFSNAIIPLPLEGSAEPESKSSHQTEKSAASKRGGTSNKKRTRQSVLDKAIAQREREWKQQQQQVRPNQGQQSPPIMRKPSRDLPPTPTLIRSPYQARSSLLREDPRSLSPIALARFRDLRTSH
ncbi:hypothetical protein A4X13_0g434 [Tilletia indica]|uniref:Uncharacterized protein n=1 Tax=Tilletia indica TaxID=43049 RepID=A0A177TL77_9BASI|nr:hypothetical protein A4X13_0g434 [Tilletia indica]